VIDGDQAGNGNYLAAPQRQQSVSVKASSPNTSATNGRGAANNRFVSPPRYKTHKAGFFSVTVRVPGPGTVNVAARFSLGGLLRRDSECSG
jgi:hypothetical protein